MTRRACDILNAGGADAHARALAGLREDTRAYWQECLAQPPNDGLTYAPIAEALKAWIDRYWDRWYESPTAELKYRGAIREQAIGVAYAAQDLDVPARYEVHLDRKLERTLAMLVPILNASGAVWPLGSYSLATQINTRSLAAFRGRALTALGQAQEGLALLIQGLAALRDTGAALPTPTGLVWLAEACAVLGQLGEGLKCLAEAAQFIEATEERANEAELYRVRGDLLNATGDRCAAEQSYRQAIAVAEQQSAKLFELRSATSLARLWRDQGKIADARALLVP